MADVHPTNRIGDPVNPIIRTTVLALSVLGLAITPVAEAAKPVKVKRARFAVTVDGVQNSSWSIDHKADGIGGCDAAYTGQGTEKVRFTSGAFSIRAMSIPGLHAPVLSRGTGSNTRSPEFKLRGSITRNGGNTVAPGPDNGCGGADGPPNPRDCGTKKFSGLGGKLDYKLASRVRDTLDVGTFNGKDPFGNCGGGGTQFPVIATRDMNQPMKLQLPRKELFDRKIGKFILIGRAREGDQNGEHKFTTTTKWVITLVRK
jgi:hypothetical protein